MGRVGYSRVGYNIDKEEVAISKMAIWQPY